MPEFKNEKQLQAYCWQWAWNTYPQLRYRLFQVHNNTSNIVEAMQKKASGLVAGVPDMCLLLPSGKVVWIEFKFGENGLSDKQKKLHSSWKEINHIIIVIRSISVFKMTIETYIDTEYNLFT